MKKAIIFSALMLAFLALALSSVSASHNYPYTEYTFDLHNGNAYSTNYRYADFYGYPSYRVYDRPIYNSRYYRSNDNRWGSDDLSYRDKTRAVRFLQNSYNARYIETSSQRSGDAFCNGCQVADSEYHASNWGNKPAFNLLATGNNQKEYYYKINYDSSAEKFNWRF